ncbi:hypothetical protein HJFPF1_01104 [Paramyrothecium foliicola]|nr:hypothetical protein HJFPF1_01104 [Paramyrothecium foliicola]
MANGLDRLERLFSSKRKLSSDVSDSTSPVAQNAEQTFPAPSFIRPRATRMSAREEHPSTQQLGLESRIRLDRKLHLLRASIGKMPISSGATKRCLDRRAEGVQIPPASKQWRRSFTAVTISADYAALKRPAANKPSVQTTPPVLVVPTRVNTPPSSEPDVDCKIQSLHEASASAVEIGAPPTPGSSPDLGPTLDPQLRDSKLFDTLDKDIGEKRRVRQVGAYGRGRPRRHSHSSFTPPPRDSVCSSTLREPDFNDFLNLSDDDIAEVAPDSLTLPSTDNEVKDLPSMDLSISSQSQLSSLLTLAPPRTSRAATAAAFEAARIATRYDFDLIYVVNLWPEDPIEPTPSSSSKLHAQQEPSTPRPLVGRLLAAHGLHHVPSPLQVSSSVHSTILRANGWIEYRNLEAEAHDLARGYACAFYTGQYAKGGSVDADAPVSGVRLSEQIDRGIVFAAYRKPRSGDSKLGAAFRDEELGKLHADAETLIEMLIDIHVANQSRQPLTPTRLSDEIGPMPSGQLAIVDI